MYIKEFNLIGECVVDVDLVCRDWKDDTFFLTTIIRPESAVLGACEKYVLSVRTPGDETSVCKAQISKAQALEIVARLKLVHIKDDFFTHGGGYVSRARLAKFNLL